MLSSTDASYQLLLQLGDVCSLERQKITSINLNLITFIEATLHFHHRLHFASLTIRLCTGKAWSSTQIDFTHLKSLTVKPCNCRILWLLGCHIRGEIGFQKLQNLWAPKVPHLTSPKILCKTLRINYKESLIDWKSKRQCHLKVDT